MYEPALDGALAHRGVTLGDGGAAVCRARWSLARGIGSEFMPPLNEGDLMFMPIADPSISLEENTEIAAKQNAASCSRSRRSSTPSPRSPAPTRRPIRRR